MTTLPPTTIAFRLVAAIGVAVLAIYFGLPLLLSFAGLPFR